MSMCMCIGTGIYIYYIYVLCVSVYVCVLFREIQKFQYNTHTQHMCSCADIYATIIKYIFKYVYKTQKRNIYIYICEFRKRK